MKNIILLLLSLCFFNLSAQSVEQNKEKIRRQNSEYNVTKFISGNDYMFQNRSVQYDKYLRDKDGNLIGKFGYLDHEGNPHYYINLSNDAAITTSTDKLHGDAGLGYDLQGTALTVLINEVGSPRSTHSLFDGETGSRIASSSEPVAGHATWVAGIIGSNDDLGISYRGMAPNVSLEMQENYTLQYEENLISNHSIIRSNGTYQPYFDVHTYDAPLHLEVTASGNVVGSSYYLANNSKNELTVGNIEDIAEYTSPMDVVYSSSGVGPTIDGRIKPDLVANGVSVSSASSASDTAIFTSGGSSASCANASGSLILVQEYYDSLVDTFMRASTLKALAVHTATEAGSYPGPDYIFGYGLLNTYEMVKLLDDNVNHTQIYEENLEGNEIFELDVYPNYNEPLIVTLSWTDPSNGQFIFPYDGNQIDTSLRALVNDLDVKIVGDGMEYFPYLLDRMNPCNPPTTGDNTFDNLEMIEIPNLPNIDGAYTIEISHKGTLVNDIQNFSLIVTGISIESSQLISKDICFEEDVSCVWEVSKSQQADVIVEGELTISDITTTNNKSISVVAGGTLTLEGADLNGVNIFVYPGSGLIVSGQNNLYNSSITILGEDVVSENNSGELKINDVASLVQKTGLYNEGLANMITGIGMLEMLENEDFLMDTICINNVISKDTIISGYDHIIIGDMDCINVCIQGESVVTLIGNKVSLSSQGIIVESGSDLTVQKHVGDDELIVPAANMNPIVHKYYNGIIYPTQPCFHVPINVYDPD